MASDREQQMDLLKALADALNACNKAGEPGDRAIYRIPLYPIAVHGMADGHRYCHSVDLTEAGLVEALKLLGAPMPHRVQPQTAPESSVVVDPELVDELEEFCLGMPADDLIEMAAQDPTGAVAAFDRIFEYAPGDQIQREDGDM